MRHRKSIAKLGRTASHRKALLANLACALFERKHIRTTEAKAKAARSYSEKLITAAKKNTVHARRIVFKKLQNKKVVKILFDEIAPLYTNRNGGYTRVIKLGRRSGDGANMAVLELVGFEKAEKKKAKDETEKAEVKKKSRKKEDQPVKEKEGEESPKKQSKEKKKDDEK